MSEAPSQRTYRVVTPRLVVRCYEPADAPLVKEAIDSSLDHLRRWLPWAREEPQTLEEKVALCRVFRGRFDLDEDYVFAILDRDERTLLGGSGLHTRVGARAREVGYWIRASAEGQGYMSEAVGALTRVGFEVEGLARIEIHCDPANERSAAVARRLGYLHEATLRERLDAGGERLRDTEVFTMFADGYPGSPAAAVPVEAYGTTGERLL